MSAYKTPIRIHINSTRKVNERVTKFRLPFQKDQPNQDKQYSLSQLDNESYRIQAHPKQDNPNRETLTLSRYQHKYGKPPSEQAESAQKLTGQDVPIENMQNVEEAGKGPAVGAKGDKQADIDIKADNDDSQKSSQSYSRNDLKKISSIKPRIFHEQPSDKKRYHSAVSDYEDEINLADRSLQSDQEFNYIYPQKDLKSSREARREESDMPLPQIKQPNRRVLHSSLKKEEHKSIWNTLSQQLDEYRSQSLHKQNQKRKKRSRQFKMDHIQSKANIKDNECLIIQTELKLLNRDKPVPYLDSKQDFYVNLPAIPEDGRTGDKLNKKQRGIIEKIKMDIQRQQQGKKSKLKYPLEHFVENYYKIREVNPFFRKLNELGGCIILSIGKLKVYESGYQVYSEGQPLTHIYINVVGKIFLTNSHKSFKKFTLTGQTLGEEALFEEGKPYHERLARGSRPMFHREQARTMSRVCLLRIKLKKYYKMSSELYSIGYKNMFNLIDNLFRINYHKKQTLHQGNKKDRLQTEILLSRNRRPSSQFFY